MRVFSSIQEVVNYLKGIRSAEKTIGFVPTMGALHEGHLALVAEAKKATDVVVVSVFVNPTQFNNEEDFDKYPNQVEQDLVLLENEKVDCVFLPSREQLYPKKGVVKFDFGYLEHIMEGEFRPGHFNGVATIVSKLFHIINPTKAFFGQKDIQQVAVIKALIEALSFQIELVVVPTLREKSGLAMSSRNQRLSEQEKKTATEIYKTLHSLQINLLEGKSFNEIQKKEIVRLESQHGFRVEYLELVKASTLQKVNTISKERYAICIATYLGEVRLIDNLLFITS